MHAGKVETGVSCIDTTVNLDINIKQELMNIAQVNGISKSLIVRTCIKRFIAKYRGGTCFFKTKTYQERGGCYRHQHLWLTPVEYEVFFDLCKTLKMTLSKIAGLALREFMTTLFESEFTDTYLVQSYEICINETEYRRIVTLYWNREEMNEQKIE